MRFIFRIEKYFSRVENTLLHPNNSNGSTNCTQYLSCKICKVVFLSTSNDIHFSERQHFFSGRKWCSPFVRFERIDNLNTMHLNHSRWSFIFLSPTNEIHFSNRQLSISRVVSEVLNLYDLYGSTTSKHHWSKHKIWSWSWTDRQTVHNTSATKYAKQYFLAPVMIFISRIDNTFSRVVSDVFHSNNSYGSTTSKHHLTTTDDLFYFKSH